MTKPVVMLAQALPSGVMFSLKRNTLLTVLVAGAASAQDVPLFTTHFPPEEFAARRARLAKSLGPDAIALIQGAPTPPGYIKFRQTNEFYYLTGVEVPHAYVVVSGRTGASSLFLPNPSRGREASEGKTLSTADAEFIRESLGFAQALAPDKLSGFLREAVRGEKPVAVYTPFAPAEAGSTTRGFGRRRSGDIANDPWDGRLSREKHLVGLLKQRLPGVEVKRLLPKLDQMRLIKSERELSHIRKATRLAGLALLESMRSTQSGIKESDLDAVGKFVFYRNGSQGDAYYSLVASASNAWYPHYHAGKRTMVDGDFLLMDYAPDYAYYTSDVTRMWPVNGKFNTWQRELYGFYLACYKSILENIAPHITAAAARRKASVQMQEILKNSSFSKPEYQRAAEKFVRGYTRGSANPRSSLGHWVGMAVHDVGLHRGPLKPGMAFTIEPALRVPEEKIYIRLEDLIIITEDGAEVVSDFVPMDIDGIEAVMREPGILQRYPREVPPIPKKRNE